MGAQLDVRYTVVNSTSSFKAHVLCTLGIDLTGKIWGHLHWYAVTELEKI